MGLVYSVCALGHYVLERREETILCAKALSKLEVISGKISIKYSWIFMSKLSASSIPVSLQQDVLLEFSSLSLLFTKISVSSSTINLHSFKDIFNLMITTFNCFKKRIKHTSFSYYNAWGTNFYVFPPPNSEIKKQF